MQNILYNPPSMVSHGRLNVGGMNEMDQLGVCCHQPFTDSLSVGAAEHWGV